MGSMISVTHRSYAPDQMTAYVSAPEKGTFRGTVVVVHHAVGIYHATFLRKYADRLAQEGFVAIVPDFFHRVWSNDVPMGYGIPFEKMNIGKMLGSLDDDDILDDIEAALDARLVNYTGVRQGKLKHKGAAILGFCMGGRIAWLAAVSERFKGRIKAAIPYHGGNVFKSLPSGKLGDGPGNRLEELHCPVLGHFGSLDKNPSKDDAEVLEREAKKHGKDVKFFSYPNSDHGFSCEDSVKYVKDQAERAWRRTVKFLKKIFPPAQKGEL